MGSRTFLIGSLLLILLCGNTPAQQVRGPNQTGWLLEVTFLKGERPAYERVRWADSKIPGDWFGRFGRVPGWEPPAGAPQICAVRIVPRLQELTVAITVSVIRGEK